MNGLGLDKETDGGIGSGVVRGLQHPLEALDVHDDLVVVALEGDGGDRAVEHTLVGGDDIHVLGADDHVHGLVLGKAPVQALKGVAREADLAVGQHEAVHDVGLTDEVGHEGVDGLVVDVHGRADLLDVAARHDHHHVGHGESLLLVVGDVDEGDARGSLDLLQLALHILAELEVQGSQRLVQEQNAGMVDQGAGDGHTLLLTAREGGDAATLKALEVDHSQHLLHLLPDLLLGSLLEAQTEGYVLVNVQMGKQRVLLKNRVDETAVGRDVRNFLPIEKHLSAIGRFKAADDPEGGGLTAPGWSKQSYELFVMDIQADIVENGLAVKCLGYPTQ